MMSLVEGQSIDLTVPVTIDSEANDTAADVDIKSYTKSTEERFDSVKHLLFYIWRTQSTKLLFGTTRT